MRDIPAWRLPAAIPVRRARRRHVTPREALVAVKNVPFPEVAGRSHDSRALGGAHPRLAPGTLRERQPHERTSQADPPGPRTRECVGDRDPAQTAAAAIMSGDSGRTDGIGLHRSPATTLCCPYRSIPQPWRPHRPAIPRVRQLAVADLITAEASCDQQPSRSRPCVPEQQTPQYTAATVPP